MQQNLSVSTLQMNPTELVQIKTGEVFKREFRQAEVGVDDGSRARASVDYHYRIGTLVVLEGSKNVTLLVFKYFK